MFWEVDSHYVIGNTHKVCQDYAISDFHKSRGRWCEADPYLIVCDGCSSAPDVDLGARILAHAAKDALSILPPLQGPYEEVFDAVGDFGSQVITFAHETAKQFELKEFADMGFPEALFATLLIQFPADGYMHTIIYGDGAAAILDVNGTVRILKVFHENNAPQYLAYQLHPTALPLYKRNFTGSTLIAQENCLPVLSSATRGFTYWIWPIEGIRMSAIMTDGVFSFGLKPEVEFEAIHRLCQVKSPNGEFVTRRLRKVISEYHKEGFGHFDDIGVAAMWKFDE